MNEERTFLLLEGVPLTQVVSALQGKTLLFTLTPHENKEKSEENSLLLYFPSCSIFRGEFAREKDKNLLSSKIEEALKLAKKGGYNRVIFSPPSYIPLYPVIDLYKKLEKGNVELNLSLPSHSLSLFSQLLK